MITYTPEQLNLIFDNLPEEAQDIIVSQSTLDEVNALIAQYNLSHDAEVFRKCVFILLIGEYTPQEFLHTLQKELNLSPEIAQHIFEELEDTVLGELYDLAEETENNPEEEERPEDTAEIDPSDASVKAQEENPTQENVLKEIENPTPSPMVTTVPLKKINPIETRTSRVIPPVPANLPVMPEKREVAIQDKNLGMVNDRLAAPTFVPQEEIKLDDKTGNKPGYTDVDPYREPIE
jgi:hypothetical protein